MKLTEKNQARVLEHKIQFQKELQLINSFLKRLNKIKKYINKKGMIPKYNFSRFGQFCGNVPISEILLFFKLTTRIDSQDDASIGRPTKILSK